MITVYKACESLGITDSKKIQRIGGFVSRGFIKRNLHGRILTESVEPAGSFKVWAYPDEHFDAIKRYAQFVESIWGTPRPKKKKPIPAIKPKRPRIIKTVRDAK